MSQKKIPGIHFLCEVREFVNGIGPEVDNKELAEWKWLSVSRIDEVEFIPSLPQEIKKAVKLYDFYRSELS